jgi:hypothetical protein
MAIHVRGATIDSISADTGSSGIDFITSDRTPTLAGTVTRLTGSGAAGTLDIYLVGGTFGTGRGALVGSVSVSKTGSWTFNLATSTDVDAQSLADGTYTIRVTDNSFQGRSLATQTLTIDTTAPAAPTIISVTDDVAPGTGIVPSGNSTNDTTPTVNSIAVGSDTVTIFEGDTQLGSASTDNNGASAFTTPTLPSTGAFILTARATDLAGNVSAPSDAYTIVEDPSAICYVAGTLILTATGERRIESLVPGDLVLALDGDELTPHPVKWLGRRRIDLAAHPRREMAAPIRIRRGSIANNMPHSDLLVSPDHAIFIDGKLICARQLINRTTIWQESHLTSVEYFHVELDTHCIVLAQGLTSESYLNTVGTRSFFTNADGPVTLHPELTNAMDYPSREAGSCRPFVWDEENVRPVWQRLAERAAALGRPVPKPDTTTDPALQIMVKGETLRPLSAEHGLYVFLLPGGTTEVSLVSRAGRLTDTRPWLEERRCFGVYVERISLRGAGGTRQIPLDHPHLSQGWWAVERYGATLRRWTDGNAVVPLPALDGPAVLEIRARSGDMAYVTGADQQRAVA